MMPIILHFGTLAVPIIIRGLSIFPAPFAFEQNLWRCSSSHFFHYNKRSNFLLVQKKLIKPSAGGKETFNKTDSGNPNSLPRRVPVQPTHLKILPKTVEFVTCLPLVETDYRQIIVDKVIGLANPIYPWRGGIEESHWSPLHQGCTAPARTIQIASSSLPLIDFFSRDGSSREASN